MHAEHIQSLIEFVRAAESTAPDDVGDVLARQAQKGGAVDAAIFLVDYEQQTLRPLSGTEDALAVDGAVGGAAYRAGQRVEIERDEGWRLWLPLVDGRVRLGVLRLDVPHLDDEVRGWATALADVTTLVVMARGVYGDGIDQVRRSRPLDLPTELRMSDLPPSSFATSQIEVAAILEPAYTVAGDGFDYAMNGQTLHLNIIDAVGHGLTSSRVANLVTAALRWSRRNGQSLEDGYLHASDVVAREAPPDVYVTASLARLAVDSGRMELLNAGHPLPLLLRAGRHVVTVECPPSLPVGLADETVPPTTTSVQLEPGDALLFHTDGVVEARSPDGREFGRQRLEDFLVQAAASRELPAELLRRLVQHILSHARPPLRDDACMTFVRWRADGPG